MARIERQPSQSSQQSQQTSQAKSRQEAKKVSPEQMLKNSDNVNNLILTKRFVLGAGEPATYGKNPNNPEEAKLTDRIFRQSI